MTKFAIAISVALVALVAVVVADDDPQALQDATIIETLLRLENFDLESSAKGKAAVERYLKRERGSDRYFELIEKFEIKSAADDLLALAVEKPGETAGVRAAQLLFKQGQENLLTGAIESDDAERAAAVVQALGLCNDPRVAEILGPLVAEKKKSLAVRSAAARALGRSLDGQRRLLKLAVDGALPADLKFTTADILLSSRDVAIQKEAAKHLELPASSGETPLPPIADSGPAAACTR